MKQFLQTLAWFAFILFIVLNLIAIPVIKYTSLNEIDNRLEMVINGQINKEVIVLGSSRGARNILASQLTQETGLSAYNLSYLGSSIEFHEFVLRSLIKFDSIPKLVILGIDQPNELLHCWGLNYRWEKMYPLVKYDYILEELAKKEEKHFLLAKVFPLHRVFRANFKFKKEFTASDSLKSHGDMPLFVQRKQFTKKYTHIKTSYRAEDALPEKVAYYKQVIELCRKNNIKLLIAFAPNFFTHQQSFEDHIKEVTGKDAFYYTFDHTNPIYKDPNYFNDEEHLLKKGATVFTHELSTYINSNEALKLLKKK